MEQRTTPVQGAGGANRFSALYNLLDPEDTKQAHVKASIPSLLLSPPQVLTSAPVLPRRKLRLPSRG